jgi:cation diffusion facilitator CzcD-associated flavoprotein CzcO
MSVEERAVVVVGAGPAGLATSRELARLRIDHVVLERGAELGHTWATLYDSLILHTGKHLSALPGMAFPRSTPLFPSREQFLTYLGRYAAEFRLPVQTDANVTTVVRGDRAGWMVRTREASIHTRALVVATGIASNPTLAEIPGRASFSGRVLHSRDYRRPDDFVSRRVLVVGVGNSAGEIAAEIATAGGRVTVAIRSGARVVPRQILGIPAQYFAVATRRLPRGAQQSILSGVGRVAALIRGCSVLPPPRDNACAAVPLIGFHLVDAIRAGTIHVKPAVDRFTPGGVRFADGSETPFDDVILATGYRPAVAMLGDLITVDECGFPRRRGRVVSADQPDLYFVGHTYDTRGALFNIGHDARRAAALIATAIRT